MRYKLAIFDFDGTLADSRAWMKRVLSEVSERYGFRAFTLEEVEALRDQDNRAILAHLGIPAWRVPFIAMHMRRLAARDADSIPLYPGIKDMLAELEARGVVLAVVSSNSEQNVRRILGPEAAGRVRHYGCGAGVFGKRRKFRTVLRRVGVSPREAISIGDEVRDIEAAAAEGIDTGAVTWGFASADLLRRHSPTWVFTSLDELMRVVPGGSP